MTQSSRHSLRAIARAALLTAALVLAAATAWEAYVRRWQPWNHLRTVSCFLAATSFAIGALQMVELAASHALTPYASSLEKHVRGTPAANELNDSYFDAYRTFNADPSTQTRLYVARKYNDATNGTRVEFNPPLNEILTDQPQSIEVTVTYERPFNVPGVGIFLGRRSAAGIGYVRDLSATVPMQLEWPRTEDGRLGFEYDSRPVGTVN